MGEGRLEEIEPHKGGKPQPIRVHPMRERETDQDKNSGDGFNAMV